MDSDGAHLVVGNCRLEVPAHRVERLKALVNKTVKLGIRPEHITTGGHAATAVQNVEGTLRFMEHMGSEVYVHFTLGDKPFTCRVPSDQLGPLAHKQRGDTHQFGIQMQSCHAFDMESGGNLFL